MLPQATSDLYDATRRRGAATALLVRSEWEKIDPAGDWWGQWLRLLPRAALIVGSSRVGAATDGVASVPAALEEFGSPSVPVKINPKAFAGWAGSGVPLADYLSSPVRVARDSPGSEVERLAAGRSWLEGLTRTAVSDAARGGSSVAIAATPRMGYTRYESAPYCQRCAPLVGKWFRWNQGFQRHPRCDAVHVPAAQDSPPEKRYTTDIDASMIRDLTEAQRKAIEEGADLYRVLNAYRGTNSDSQRTSMFTTREASRGALRPTPEGIYARAGDDRENALALLRQHGYLR